VPPGSYLDRYQDIGRGHVFKSTDAGETFTNISGNLPNLGANWIEIHGRQLVVGTDLGVFLSRNRDGSRWAALDDGLPAVPISTIRNHPGTGTRSWPPPSGGASTPTPSRARAGDQIR
jgi:hypothetical protein